MPIRQGLCRDMVSVRPSVCPSVCHICRPLHAVAAVLLLAGPGGLQEISIGRRGAAQRYASSVTLSADVGS